MTPLGHSSVAFITAATLTKLLPAIDQKIILSGVICGGVILDLDLVYHVLKNGRRGLGRDIGKHRFLPTHTVFFSLILSLLVSIFNIYIALFFFIGTLIHFFCDMFFFPEGINLFYPITKKTRSFFVLKTKSFLAPKKIYNSDNWWKNYLTSPLFWIYEGIPLFISFVILLAK